LQRQRFRRAAAARVLGTRGLAEALRFARRDRQAGERVAAIAADRGGGGADRVVAGHVLGATGDEQHARDLPFGALGEARHLGRHQIAGANGVVDRRAVGGERRRSHRAVRPFAGAATSVDNAGLATTASAVGGAAVAGAASALGDGSATCPACCPATRSGPR
jgi:hypothetical protein